MLSREQGQALTRLLHLMRPAWNEAGIYAALGQVAQRNEFDVALAALRAAADSNVKTPGVIPTDGPHWHEAPPATKAPTRRHLSRDEMRARTCETCGALDDRHAAKDHPFVPLTRATEHRAEPTVDLHAEIQPTRTYASPEANA